MIRRWYVEEDRRHQEEQWRLLYRDEAKQIDHFTISIFYKNEHTKRMPDNCYLSCIMRGDGFLNGWEDDCRRAWYAVFF